MPLTPPPVRLRWLGTAGFQVAWGGGELLLDPFLSRRPGATPVIHTTPEDLRGASLILVSHGHFDHAQDAAALARLSGATLYAPRATCRFARRSGVRPDRLHANEDHLDLMWPGALAGGTRPEAVGSIRILPSRHIRFDLPLVVRTLTQVVRGGVVVGELLRRIVAWPMGSNSDFLLCLGEERILFSGSGGGDFARLAALRPTCFLLPFAGRTDVVAHYMAALRLLRPATVVLHHFDDFFPSFVVPYPVAELVAAVARELPQVRVIVPQPEVWFDLTPAAAPSPPPAPAPDWPGTGAAAR